jgi:hypothetical protein
MTATLRSASKTARRRTPPRAAHVGRSRQAQRQRQQRQPTGDQLGLDGAQPATSRVTTNARTSSGHAAVVEPEPQLAVASSTVRSQNAKDRSTNRDPTASASRTVRLLARANPQMPYVVRW